MDTNKPQHHHHQSCIARFADASSFEKAKPVPIESRLVLGSTATTCSPASMVASAFHLRCGLIFRYLASSAILALAVFITEPTTTFQLWNVARGSNATEMLSTETSTV
mmetsp:Transcript_31325/g.51857  ORF Transcript_31325/g.51857 Transcript_31325/m.51857 type:complete len:108 (-) Transcript_31325:23-346(-)